jgi:serine/threonine protein kinase
MTSPLFCPHCGKPLTGDAPQGLCPECLLKAALLGQSSITVSGTTASAPEAGARIKYFGDYELLEEIARGGMGVVWKARQTSLKRDVALKMIRAGALASHEEVQRFLREAEAAANLQHPNIVAIHEVGEHDGQHYFSMDYVAGRDLGAILQDGPLSAQVAARYVKIIAEAIHFAHQRGTLHRDLKPQNVLIDEADQPRITDFGLAKITKDDRSLTQTGAVMGSPSYMPPEQAAGRVGDIGPASDVYSLGAMLYELLTGRPPFRGATAMATLYDVMETEPVSPRRLKLDIPADLETICLKCLEKASAARYPTARALAEELDRFLKGEPIQARPASMVRKTVSWARRHPGTLAALAALVMVGLSVGVYYLFEENAFLRARQENPKLSRESGPRQEMMFLWESINVLVMSAGIWAFIFLGARARGLSVKQFRDFALVGGSPIHPLGERTRTMAICMSLVLIVSGVGLLARTIQVHVWEGGSIWRDFFGIYASIYFGITIVGILIRDYRLRLHGAASRHLTPEQIAAITRAMEDYNVPAAIKLYRQAVPDAGIGEANQYVLRLAETQRAKHPGKFVPPSWSQFRLNGRAMLICGVIEAAVFGVWWVISSPAYPGWVAAQLGCTFLFGVAVLACARVKGHWKRALLLVPPIVATIVCEVLRFYSADTSDRVLVAIIGFFGGFLLMVSAFTPRRRRS